MNIRKLATYSALVICTTSCQTSSNKWITRESYNSDPALRDAVSNMSMQHALDVIKAYKEWEHWDEATVLVTTTNVYIEYPRIGYAPLPGEDTSKRAYKVTPYVTSSLEDATWDDIAYMERNSEVDAILLYAPNPSYKPNPRSERIRFRIKRDPRWSVTRETRERCASDQMMRPV